MRGSPPPLWFCPRYWLQTTPKTTATWATSNSSALPANPTAFGGRSRRARRSVLCSREGFTDDPSGVKGSEVEPRTRPLRCAAKSWLTPTAYLDFLSFQALPDSERRNWLAAMLYRC